MDFYPETAEERAVRIAVRADEARPSVSMTPGQAATIERAALAEGLVASAKPRTLGPPDDYHYHQTKEGLLVRCYHSSRALLTNWQFWAGMTLGFPVEHLIWEKLWPFSLVTRWFGL